MRGSDLLIWNEEKGDADWKRNACHTIWRSTHLQYSLGSSTFASEALERTTEIIAIRMRTLTSRKMLNCRDAKVSEYIGTKRTIWDYQFALNFVK